MTPTRKPAKNNNGDQDSGSTNSGVPSPYLEPPPFYTAMVSDFASRQHMFLSSEEKGPSSLLSQQKSHIRKYQADVSLQTESEKSGTCSKKEEEMKGKMEGLVVSEEGGSQGIVIPREMILCCICINSAANMIWLPCRHLCVCSGCDNKSPKCPMCGITKRSSFSV